jgi:hypothetical protein
MKEVRGKVRPHGKGRVNGVRGQGPTPVFWKPTTDESTRQRRGMRQTQQIRRFWMASEMETGDE